MAKLLLLEKPRRSSRLFEFDLLCRTGIPKSFLIHRVSTFEKSSSVDGLGNGLFFEIDDFRGNVVGGIASSNDDVMFTFRQSGNGNLKGIGFRIVNAAERQ